MTGYKRNSNNTALQPLFLTACLSAFLLWAGCSGMQSVPSQAETETSLPSSTIDSELACGTAHDENTESSAPAINQDVFSFELSDGLPVILKRTPGKPVVAVRLFINGGSRNLTRENAGIEALTLDLATEGGTASLDRSQYTATLDAMGSAIGNNTALDYSEISMNSLSAYLPETWALLTEVLRQPAFPEDELDRIRELHIQAINMRQDDPDNRVVDLARGMLFTDHPYENLPRGHIEVLEQISRDDIVDYWGELLDPSRMLLVVVGDISPEAFQELASDTFSDLNNSTETLPLPPPFSQRTVDLSVSEMDIPTNYILGVAPAPNPGHEDYAAMVLAMSHLGDRLFEEVRSRRNLTYAVSAGFGRRLANYAYFYVTATDPDLTIPVIYDEIERLQNTPLTETELRDLIAVFITEYYSALDSNGAVASALGWWDLFGGGRGELDSYISRLREISAADIQRTATQYLSGFQVGVVGNPDQVSLELFQMSATNPSENPNASETGNEP